MSVINNWTNPFANQVSTDVKVELQTRQRFLSAISRNEDSSRNLNQIFSPVTSTKNRNDKALEWVYQKVAYAHVVPIKLEKDCNGNKKNEKDGTGDGKKELNVTIEEITGKNPWSHLSTGLEIYERWKSQEALRPQWTVYGYWDGTRFLDYDQNGGLNRSSKNLNKFTIKKQRAPFVLSTQKFVDKKGELGGAIEKYGEDLYGVPQLYKSEDGTLKYTIKDSLYRPMVTNGDPNAVLTSISIVNEGVVGSVLRAKMNIKVFTKEALNILDEWLLRPGNEVDLFWGWSSYASNQNLNQESLNAVIFNFSCEYKEDNTWDVSVDAIAKGSLVSGVSFEVPDESVELGESDADNVQVPNLRGIISKELQELQISGSSQTVIDSAAGLTSLTSTIYKSNIFPHGIAQFTHPLSDADDPWLVYAGGIGRVLGAPAGAAIGIAAGTVGGPAGQVGGGLIGFAAGATAGQSLGEYIANLFVETDYVIIQKNYICLSDLIHYFNTVLTTQYFPKSTETFELQVENSPTSYDPNLVSSDPLKIMFSDNSVEGFNQGMATYGDSNRSIKTYTHGDISSFYAASELNTWDDCLNNHTPNAPNINKNKSKYGNLGHIWIETDFIQQVFTKQQIDKGVDPRFKNIFSFFEEIFKAITTATGGAIKPTFVQQNIFGDSLTNDYSKKGIRSVIWIVDSNFMLSHEDNDESAKTNKFPFKVDDVGTTLLRNVNMRLKLPSSMQSTAYTFGRAGLNDNIQTLDEAKGSGCYDTAGNKTENKISVYNALQTLSRAKELCKYGSTDNLTQNLQSALFSYIGNPTKADTNPTISQGWIFSRLYPAELAFEIDGISGLKYGNMIRVFNALPTRYNEKIFFTITKLEHTISNHDWKLNVTAIARLEQSHKQTGYALNDSDVKNAKKSILEGEAIPMPDGRTESVPTPTGGANPT